MKKLFLGAMALLAAVTLVACGSKKTLTNLLKKIKNLSQLSVQTMHHLSSKLQSTVRPSCRFRHKLAQAIADELGVKLEVTTMSFDNVLSSLQAGKADIAISGISVTDERKKTFDFSDPYYETQNAIIVRKDQESTYSSLDAFKGKKVAVKKVLSKKDLLRNS